VNINNLSFDPAHRWFDVPGVAGAVWAIEIFTREDAFGLDPDRTAFDGCRLVSEGFQRLGGAHKAAGTATVECRRGDDDATTWTISVQAVEPVKSVKLLIRNLPSALLEQGWWTPTTPAGHAGRDRPVLLAYPWSSSDEHWQTPWVCTGNGPGLSLSVRDESVRAKRFYAYQPHWSDSEIVEVVCTPSASARHQFFELPEIRLALRADEAEIQRDFDEHLAWLEGAYRLPRWEERRDVPAWADELELVVTLHGQHWTGHVFNTFDRMAEVLETVCEEIPGERILAYLPGWEGRYYWQYPIYGPGEDLGGEEGFARLVEVARALGVHLMPMFGANGANMTRYPEWERAAFRSASNRYVALVNTPDWDNDRFGEDDQIFLNPGEPDFQAHLVGEVSKVVDRFGIEGVFLDTSACWFDDPRYDVYRGYLDLVGEIRRRHPGLLVCGEGWYDALLAVFPLNQTWLDMAEPSRFDALPMRYSKVLGHLNYGAPGTGSTGVHEGGTHPVSVPFRRDGFVPALPVTDDTFTRHRDAALAFCRAIARDRL
jgi:hypothetical protein